MGCSPIETGEWRVSRRSIRFGGSRDAVGACSSDFSPGSLWRSPWAHVRCSIEPLTPLSQPRSIPAPIFRAPFRGTRGPIRTMPPRPLCPRRREATRPSPVRDAFDRQRMRCSSSALSDGDSAPDPGPNERLAPPAGFPQARHHLALRARRPRRSARRRSRLLSSRIAAQREASHGNRAARDANSPVDCTSASLAPVHLDPRPLVKSGGVWGKGFFGPSCPSISAMRQQRTGTSASLPPRPPQDLELLAKPKIPKRSGIGRPPSFPDVRAVRDAPPRARAGAALLPTPRPTFVKRSRGACAGRHP